MMRARVFRPFPLRAVPLPRLSTLLCFLCPSLCLSFATPSPSYPTLFRSLPFRFSICFMLSAYHFSMAMCNLCSICCCCCCSCCCCCCCCFHILLYVLHGIYCAAIFHIIFWGSFIVCPFFREYNSGGRQEGGAAHF